MSYTCGYRWVGSGADGPRSLPDRIRCWQTVTSSADRPQSACRLSAPRARRVRIRTPTTRNGNAYPAPRTSAGSDVATAPRPSTASPPLPDAGEHVERGDPGERPAEDLEGLSVEALERATAPRAEPKGGHRQLAFAGEVRDVTALPTPKPAPSPTYRSAAARVASKDFLLVPIWQSPASGHSHPCVQRGHSDVGAGLPTGQEAWGFERRTGHAARVGPRTPMYTGEGTGRQRGRPRSGRRSTDWRPR
jgi:hypothetical protein